MNPFEQVFYPTLGAGCVLGAFLAWNASGRRLPGQIMTLSAAILAVWLSLFLGVHCGYGSWQSMENPPDEAFADGAWLTGSVLFGWMPSAFGCSLVFLAGLVWRLARGRRRSAPTSAPR